MNGLLCINKPQNMTSFDVVSQVRRTFHTKKVGHSGTLDPNATGILVIALNKATKSLPYLDVFDKTYHTKMTFGKKTDTGDIWGEILEEQAIETFSLEQIKTVLKNRIGKQKQRVPMVSAKKHKGKKLYEYHRAGIEVETKYTDIEIYDIEFLNYENNILEFKAHVSNGTYIRTLVEDIAEDLGSIACMTYLDRIHLGAFTMADALDLEALTIDTRLLDPRPYYNLKIHKDESLDEDISFGKRIQLDVVEDQIIVDGGTHFAVYQREFQSQFKSVRGLW